MTINKESFAVLLQAAREMKPETFHMRNYGHRAYITESGETWDSAFDFGDNDDPQENPQENPHCGSPMCLLGHLAAREDLQSFLTFRPKTATIFYREPVEDEDWHGDKVMVTKQACYYDEALCEWFGIDRDQAEALFGTQGCDDARTPQQAIEYIEAFLSLEENNERARAKLGL